MYVRLSRRWACLCQSLTEINIAVQQLDEIDREVKLWSHIGGGHYVDFRKWFQPPDQKDPKPTRKGIALNLDQWVRMRKIVETINNDHPVFAADTLPGCVPKSWRERGTRTAQVLLCAQKSMPARSAHYRPSLPSDRNRLCCEST